MASLRGGANRPGATPSREVTPDLKLFLWLNLERTLDKRRAWEDGSGEETTAKKVVTRAMTKKKQKRSSADFFEEKIG